MGSALHSSRVPHNLALVCISNLICHNSPLTYYASAFFLFLEYPNPSLRCLFLPQDLCTGCSSTSHWPILPIMLTFIQKLPARRHKIPASCQVPILDRDFDCLNYLCSIQNYIIYLLIYCVFLY